MEIYKKIVFLIFSLKLYYNCWKILLVILVFSYIFFKFENICTYLLNYLKFLNLFRYIFVSPLPPLLYFYEFNAKKMQIFIFFKFTDWNFEIANIKKNRTPTSSPFIIFLNILNIHKIFTRQNLNCLNF